MEYLLSALWGCAVGVAGTGAGGAAAVLIGRKRDGKKLASFLMGFSGGVMLAVVFLELTPESIALSGPLLALAGAVGGGLFIALIGRLLPRQDDKKDKALGFMLLTGIALHNLPEGLAVGAGINGPEGFGMRLALLIMLHDIPEGLAMAIPLKSGGVKSAGVILLAAAAGLPTALGALAGYAVGSISTAFVGASTAFAGGAMLWLTLTEIAPECYNEGGLIRTVISCAAGFMTGALMAVLL